MYINCKYGDYAIDHLSNLTFLFFDLAFTTMGLTIHRASWCNCRSLIEQNKNVCWRLRVPATRRCIRCNLPITLVLQYNFALHNIVCSFSHSNHVTFTIQTQRTRLHITSYFALRTSVQQSITIWESYHECRNFCWGLIFEGKLSDKN